MPHLLLLYSSTGPKLALNLQWQWSSGLGWLPASGLVLCRTCFMSDFIKSSCRRHLHLACLLSFTVDAPVTCSELNDSGRASFSILKCCSMESRVSLPSETIGMIGAFHIKLQSLVMRSICPDSHFCNCMLHQEKRGSGRESLVTFHKMCSEKELNGQ